MIISYSFRKQFFCALFIYSFFSCKKEDTSTPQNAFPGLPLVTTKDAVSITQNTAISGGSISSDGGFPVKSRGVYWSTSPVTPSALGTKTSNGTGMGSFSSSISKLIPDQVYYVRAYATNSTGTAYGNQISFRTAKPSDLDGNTYNVIVIGQQVWMKENLKVSRFRNGDPIPANLDSTLWSENAGSACCFYEDNPSNQSALGRLYNWYAVSDPRGLCPDGWHVPDNAEWTTLENYLGNNENAGGKMKSTGTKQGGTGLWNQPNSFATNSSQFSANPGGYRTENGAFILQGYLGTFWTSSESDVFSASLRGLNYNHGYLEKNYSYKQSGLSVRCIAD